MTTQPTDAALRKRKSRAKLAALELVRVEEVVHQDDAPPLKQFAAKLRERRGKKT